MYIMKETEDLEEINNEKESNYSYCISSNSCRFILIPTNIAKYAIAAGVSILAALAYREIVDLKESHKPYSKLIKALGFVCLEFMVFHTINASYIYNGASFATIGLVLLLLLIPSIFDKKGNYTTKDAFYLMGTTVVIGLFFNLLMLLFNVINGFYYILF